MLVLISWWPSCFSLPSLGLQRQNPLQGQGDTNHMIFLETNTLIVFFYKALLMLILPPWWQHLQKEDNDVLIRDHRTAGLLFQWAGWLWIFMTNLINLSGLTNLTSAKPQIFPWRTHQAAGRKGFRSQPIRYFCVFGGSRSLLQII